MNNAFSKELIFHFSYIRQCSISRQRPCVIPSFYCQKDLTKLITTLNLNDMSEAEARKYIAELFKIVGTDSILVVLHTGKVKRLYCPFIVICKFDVSPLQKGSEYSVEAVKMTLQLQDVFIIQGKGYFVWYFNIKI